MTDNRGLGVKSGYAKESWESSEFPSVCETCLGSSPYMRMVKQTHAGTCKMCERPYTLFRWNPRQGARQKRTEICQTCSRIKNICQCCLLDLQYGLPVQLRDAVLSANEAAVAAPESDANREWFAQQQNQLIAAGQDPWLSSEPNEQLLAIARQIRTDRQDDQLKLTLANTERKRAAADPEVAEVIERSKKRAAVQNAGIDSAIVVEGITESVTADDVREAFHRFGDIKTNRLYHKQKLAIVWFVELPSAQRAVAELSPQGVGKQAELEMKDAARLSLRWATAADMAEIVEEQLRQRAQEEEEQKRKEAVAHQGAAIPTSQNSSSQPLPPGMTEADLQALPAVPAGFTPAAAIAAPQAQMAGYPADLAQQWQQYYAYYGMYGQGHTMPAAAAAPAPVAKKLPPKPKGPPPAHAFRNGAAPQVTAQRK